MVATTIIGGIAATAACTRATRQIPQSVHRRHRLLTGIQAETAVDWDWAIMMVAAKAGAGKDAGT
jgi:hypothetical protein